MVIAVDFDGTCVTHEFPKIGNEGVRLVDTLQEAIDWFRKNEIPLYGVNENPTQHNWTSSKKIFAHIYIVDSALGIPLKHE